MADSKNNTNTEDTVAEVAPTEAQLSVTPVQDVDQGSPAQLEEADYRPDLQLLGDVSLKPGENLYFFPDIQKSVTAKSLEDATKQVQTELDAIKSEENK